jgi:predicted nucleotidyltransferase
MPVAITDTLAHLRRLEAARRATAQARVDDVRARLPGVAAALREEFGIERVTLFGSFARGDVHDESDVDLAIPATLPSRYFEAVGRCSRLLGYDVHLVELDRAPDSLVARVAAEGIEY